MEYAHYHAQVTQTIHFMNNTSNTGVPQHGWTIQKIRDLIQARFGKRACWYQVQTALALYEGKDVVGCAPTGAGKTMSFMKVRVLGCKLRHFHQQDTCHELICPLCDQ